MRRSLPGAEPNAAGHASTQVDAGLPAVDDIRMVVQQTEPSDGAPAAHVGESEAPFTVTAPVPYAGSGSLRSSLTSIRRFSELCLPVMRS